MVQAGFREPNNKVRNGGSLSTEELIVGANATAAKMLPCIVVIRDTNDYSVQEWSAGNHMIGYLSYENSPDKPETMDTAYAVGDTVGVEVGAGRRQLARLTTSQTIVKGQPLKVTTDGYLAAAVVNGVVSVDESGSATVSTGNDDIVADADESVATTSAAAKIWVITRK
jgi:hypothetical protein